MKVLLTIKRKDCINGENMIKYCTLLDHTPIELDKSTLGWDGTGKGLSEEDFKEVMRKIEGCGNIHSLKIELVDE